MVSNYFWVVFLLCKECSVTADGEKGKITLISEVLLNEPDYQRLRIFLVYAGEFFSYSTLNPNSGVSVFDGPYRRFFFFFFFMQANYSKNIYSFHAFLVSQRMLDQLVRF
jgi:hypothetical protein